MQRCPCPTQIDSHAPKAHQDVGSLQEGQILQEVALLELEQLAVGALGRAACGDVRIAEGQ